MSERLVVRGGFVVSMDADVGELPNADVLVEDGKIVEIGPGLEVGDAEVVDATGKLVLPGFVDTHRHTWQTPVRGVLPSCTLDATSPACSDTSGSTTAPRTCTSATMRVARGAQRRDHDAARLVAHQQHARALRRGDRGPDRRGHPRRVRARRPRSATDWWAYSRPEHPEDIRRIRKQYFSSDDQLLTLAHGGARARQHDAGGRAARLGARARPRDPDQRPRRHAADGRPRAPHPEHARARAHGPGHDLHPLHRLDGRGARPDRRDRRQRLGRAVRRDADGPRRAADGPAARARRAAVAQRSTSSRACPGEHVHADAHGARAGADPGVHGHARHGVRADADAPRRARVRDDRRRARLRASITRWARSRRASRPTSS